MKIEASHLSELGLALAAERKHQKLSREQAASVCGVSASFIRDAESSPENCSLGKLVRLITGLGLSLNASGWTEVQGSAPYLPLVPRRPDFGVADDQLVPLMGEPS
jgi:transcriptional regulator with XRE-family HTH domain